MSVVIDYLRPNSACFEDPPKKSKDKCEVDAKFHEGEQKYYLSLQRTPAGFAYAPENSSATLAFLSSNGFDLLKPEIKGRIYYAVALSGRWMSDYTEYKKTHRKASDFSQDIEKTVHLINLGNFTNPDNVEKEAIKEWMGMILNADADKKAFFAEHLIHPVGQRSHLLTPAILSRVSYLLDTLYLGSNVSDALAGLSPQHPLYARSKEVLAGVLSFIYMGEPELKSVIESVGTFSKRLYAAKDVHVKTSHPDELPLPNTLLPEKMLDPERYNYFEVLAKSLEPKDRDYSLQVEGDMKARLELVLKWLKLESHVAELQKAKAEGVPEMLIPLPSVSLPPPSPTHSDFEDLPPLPPPEPILTSAAKADKAKEPIPTVETEVNLFPPVKPKEELPKQAFVVPPVVEETTDTNRARKIWLPVTEGSLCALGGVLTTVGALQKTNPGERNPLFISGTTSAGAGCLSLLVHFVSPKSWNPYVADGVSAGGGAVAGFLIPWFIGPSPNPRENEPVSSLNTSERNPTWPFGP